MELCSICCLKPVTRRSFCQNCYVKGLRNGTIRKLEKPPLPDKLTKDQHEIIIGSMLGDGCLFRPKNATHPFLSITRATKDIEYLEWQYLFFKDFCSSKVSTIDILDKRTNKTYHQSKFCTRRSYLFDNYYNDWYPYGKKVIPKNIILSPLTCAIWFCDDGSVTVAKKTINRLVLKLSTHGFSINDVEFLVALLTDKYKEKFCIAMDNLHPIIYSSDNATRAFLKDIDSYIPTEMDRKIKWRDPNILFYKGIERSRNYSNLNGKRIYD